MGVAGIMITKVLCHFLTSCQLVLHKMKLLVLTITKILIFCIFRIIGVVLEAAAAVAGNRK